MSGRRNTPVTILRVAAAFAVVLYHVLGCSTVNDPLVLPQTYRFITAINKSLEWHVPVFYMITGYLWLKEGKSCTYKDVARPIRRFIYVLITVGYAYALMERVFVERTIHLQILLLAMADVLSGNLWDHMWYMYSVIGVYLLLPVIKPFFETSSTKHVLLLTALVYCFTVITPALESNMGIHVPVGIPMVHPAFYLCAGGLVSRMQNTLKQARTAVVALFICSSSAAFTVQYVWPGNKWIAVFSSISAVTLFIGIHGWFLDFQESRWLRSASDCSFGIYLFHPFFINIMVKVLHIYPFRSVWPVSVAAMTVCVILLSWASTYLLRKVRFIRYYIL